MLRTAALVLLVLAMAIGGGAGSVWYALGASSGLGALQVGAWTAFPLAGTPQADPYSRARTARRGELPLGRAEGLRFVAARDTAGNLLRRNCTYRVEGQVPTARLWTMHAAYQDRSTPTSTENRPGAIASLAVLREPDNSIMVTVSRTAAPGNWIAIEGEGPMRLVLSLYDTPSTSGEDIDVTDMPQILRDRCDG